MAALVETTLSEPELTADETRTVLLELSTGLEELRVVEEELLRDITERRQLDRELRQLRADVELLEALAELNRLVAERSDSLEPMLQGLVELAASASGGAHAGVTVPDDRGHIEACAVSDAVAEELGRIQLDTGGPARQVLQEGKRRVDNAGDLAEWPELDEAVDRHGVEWVLSHPIPLEGGSLCGVFHLYGGGPVEEVERSVQPLAEQAAGMVANGRLYRSAVQLAGHLERALESRGVIEQAKGILMAWQCCDADQAFDILRRASQRENRKLRAIAEEIVEKAMRAGPDRRSS
ncbi:MAG: ANTAR domain-containing protein [Acidimicrobiales bacterium]